eukprot:TRINITY_DN2728_c0_g1_i1.p1 TRINITY_DN2728_c0_g1~~TRINITY_DN2728_c0_g1_i1.p1  ORF type:complete len:501 (-),score=85.57 TRINITY_DN2728_c0_g1_i1:768-2270(-)
MNLFLYNFVKWLTFICLPLYMSEVVVIGRKHVIKQGPVIVFGNHPNMLLDILTIGATCGRPLSFWAKSTMFKGVFGWLLRSLGALPVKRRMDVKSKGSPEVQPAKDAEAKSVLDNTALAQDTFRGFYEGRAMCIFPEGTSHSESHLMKLKDGTAWMLFQWYDQTGGSIPVPIIPCGLPYISKNRWRCKVVIQYAHPVSITREQLEEFRRDPKMAVKKFTAQLEQVLLSLTVNTEDWETMKIVHAVRRLYMSDTSMNLAQYVEVTRRFADFYSRSKDNKEVKELRVAIQNYQDQLDDLQIRDQHVRKGLTLMQAWVHVFKRLLFLLVLLPLALPGLVVNFPLIASGKLMNMMTPFQEYQGTLKFLSGLFIIPLGHLLFAFVISYFTAVSIFIVLVGMIIVSTVNVLVLEEEAVGYRSLVSTLRLLWAIIGNGQKSEIVKLQAVRKTLVKKVTEMVDRHATPEQKNAYRSIEQDARSPFSLTARSVKKIPKRVDSYSDIGLL